MEMIEPWWSASTSDLTNTPAEAWTVRSASDNASPSLKSKHLRYPQMQIYFEQDMKEPIMKLT